MTSSVSFAGTYKVSSQHPESFRKFTNYVRYVEFNDIENKTKNVLTDKIVIDKEGEPNHLSDVQVFRHDGHGVFVF